MNISTPYLWYDHGDDTSLLTHLEIDSRLMCDEREVVDAVRLSDQRFGLLHVGPAIRKRLRNESTGHKLLIFFSASRGLRPHHYRHGSCLYINCVKDISPDRGITEEELKQLIEIGSDSTLRAELFAGKVPENLQALIGAGETANLVQLKILLEGAFFDVNNDEIVLASPLKDAITGLKCEVARELELLDLKDEETSAVHVFLTDAPDQSTESLPLAVVHAAYLQLVKILNYAAA